MSKRKIIVSEPNYWKKDEFFLVPHGHKSFKELRDEFPNIRVIYIKNCTSMAICKEVMVEHNWINTTSDYYIVNNEEIDSQKCSNIEKFRIVLKNQEIKWNGVNFIHRETVVCDKCFIIGELTPKNGCLIHIPKCNHRGSNKLEFNCQYCYARSFASYWSDIVNCIKTKENVLAIFKYSNKEYNFKCFVCCHLFSTILYNLMKGNFCSYCAHKKLCGKKECDICFQKSFASVADNMKRDSLQTTKDLMFLFKQSNKIYDFKCFTCNHIFSMPLSGIENGQFCPYCAHQKLCGKAECKTCYEKSFASFDIIKRNCIITTENLLLIFKHSGKKYNFKCFVCNHLFSTSLSALSAGNFCRFCRGFVCGDENCLTCAQQCIMATCTKKAIKQTRITKKWYCEEHFKDCISRDPKETFLMVRAKISLEIYTLAELQRVSMQDNNNFYWSHPTNWDCKMIPNISYRPDNLFAFDKNLKLLQYADDQTLNLSNLGYVIIIEILEEGRYQHSKSRSISDESREREIRFVFDIHHVPIGFLYVSMAHNRHFNAHKDDIFFHKNSNGEYEVLSSRQSAFSLRIKNIEDTLRMMFENKMNASEWIGH